MINLTYSLGIKCMNTFKQRLSQTHIYDNGGKTSDRYTAVYIFQPEKAPNTFSAVGMNDKPFHPMGIGMHCTAMPGQHLGKRIKFEDLPEDCQKVIIQDLID